jgi:hypothetical protein
VSRSLRIVLALFVWWLLVVIPGLLTITGAFGAIGPEADLTPWVIAVWVAFFLAQLAWLMVVCMKAVGHSRIGWVFIASLLPWVVDWSAPYGWGWGLLWIGVAGGIAAGMTVLALRSLRLETKGRRAVGTVVKVLPNRMNVVINNIYVRRRVLLQIPGADGTPYEAVLPMLCEIGTAPAKGDTFPLRVDPDHPKHFALEPSTHRDDE